MRAADQEVLAFDGKQDCWLTLDAWLRSPAAAVNLSPIQVSGGSCQQFLMRGVFDLRPRHREGEMLARLEKGEIIVRLKPNEGIICHFPKSVRVEVTVHLAEALVQG